MKLISREEAIRLGLKRYFTGKPCLNGHIAERWVGCRKCIPCRTAVIQNWRVRNPEKVQAAERRNRVNNYDKRIKHARAYRAKIFAEALAYRLLTGETS